MNPALWAIVAGLPATALGALAWWRSRKVDAVAEQSGIATENRAGVEQIIQGLNVLVTNLQYDNNAFREELKDTKLQLGQELKDVKSELVKIRADLGTALREIERLRSKYQDPGPPT